jgi:hypothetical protein
MEYQMLIYFDKFTFIGLLFLQVAISYLSSTLCRNVRFLIPHCLYYVTNSTLTHSQLHIAKSSTPHCKQYIANLPNLFYFLGYPHFSHCPLKKLIFCSIPKIHSVGAQTRFFGNFFLPIYLVYQHPIHKATYPPRLFT